MAGTLVVAPATAAGRARTTGGPGSRSRATREGTVQGTMYGRIGKMTAVEGRRDTLAEILLEGLQDMPGCLSYVVAEDSTDENALWITEVWDSRESHEASLALPAVQDAIARGRPLIAGFGEQTETVPLGGHGLEAPGRA